MTLGSHESLPLRGRWHGEAVTEGESLGQSSLPHPLRGSPLPEGAENHSVVVSTTSPIPAVRITVRAAVGAWP